MPMTRRSGSGSGSRGGGRSPKKASSSPKKVVPLKRRTTRDGQPRIDDTLASTRGRRGRSQKVLKSQTFEIIDVDDECKKEPQASSSVTPRTSPMKGFLSQDSAGTSSVNSSPSIPSASSSVANSPVKKIGKKAALQALDNLPPNGKDARDQEILRDFDLNGSYGASRGISRRERYERALQFRLDPPPPKRVYHILEERQRLDPNHYEICWDTCIWDQKEMLMAMA